MADQTKELVVLMTKGTDHELSSVGFSIANGGMTAGLKVYMFLTSAAVDLVGGRGGHAAFPARGECGLDRSDEVGIHAHELLVAVRASGVGRGRLTGKMFLQRARASCDTNGVPDSLAN